MINRWFVLIVVAYPLLALENGYADDNLKFSLFIDTYSAYAENELASDERPYFTQSSRNNDYHLNLASAGFTFDDGLTRAVLSGQYGESVSINYNAEPEDSFKYVQESYLGIHLSDSTRLDFGTFLAHIGAENWLSKNNLTYTRSYIAEFSPYYETGVRLSHTFDKAWSAQLLGLNGWQNTSDNRHPALGTQVVYAPNQWSFSSNTFLGEESYGTRLFHDLIASYTFDSQAVLLGSIDVGHQSNSATNSGNWWGYTFIGKQPLTDYLSTSARIESYQDPNGIIVTSVTGEKFRAHGASVGLDISLGQGLYVRSELKRLWSSHAIFLDNERPQKNDTLFVISLSFSNEQ